MRVVEIMTREVQTLREDSTLAEAEATMRASQIRHLPVVDGRGAVVGMVSDRDVRQAALSSVSGPLVAFERRTHLTRAEVRRIMHTPIHLTTPSALVQEVAGVMRRLKVGSLPVVEDGILVGIVTEADVLRAVESIRTPCLDQTTPPSRTPEGHEPS